MAPSVLVPGDSNGDGRADLTLFGSFLNPSDEVLVGNGDDTQRPSAAPPGLAALAR